MLAVPTHSQENRNLQLLGRMKHSPRRGDLPEFDAIEPAIIAMTTACDKMLDSV
ncbi:hypothetical protein ONO86_05533 [Micromonospora noduli]|uniref:hypothetical protein n=1 Tax=Micromonospora noduli TaxID=709876 RepID=UPI000DC60FAF|nr:hypothetical protein [Micromonospora noduli]RAO30363.1 hypothetical protein ONO86_05533 [Micromonospora noduli]